ncbi:RNA polymerase sigma factor [Paenibacillus humicola]|uniref:RNA polymerase sigma factor n=1 Tax=Paenibacillus humicola TaxID=3110540 RepID=UPI00237A57F0|nr:RNA polymerase sigma factor [Paenibacillus humicola]
MKPWTEFEDVIKPHMGPLRTYCLYLTASKWEAEDLLQEALLRAFQMYRKKGEFQHPRSLLYKITRNLHIDLCRRRRGVTVPIEEAMEQPHHDQNYASVRGLLEWLTESLSEREVDMLMLAEVFRYTYQDIADELRCSVPAVKMVLHRSKQALRKQAETPEADTVKTRKTGRKPRKFAVERWTAALMTGEL